MKRRKYPIIVFYLTGVKDELSADQMQTLRASAPSLVLEFHPVTHVIPQRFRGNIKKILEHQMPKRGLGYIFCRFAPQPPPSRGAGTPLLGIELGQYAFCHAFLYWYCN